jgi:hypothetical protein
MNRKPIFIAVLVIALVTMACGINIDLPREVKTGPTQTDEISVPLTADVQVVTDLTISFAGGELELAPGAEGVLASGTATYNVTDFRPEVSTNGNVVRIEQGELNVRGIPNFKDNVINEWSLKLASVPTDLRINAGAYSGKYELGGLSLERLTIADGASDVSLMFSEPNQTEMSVFEYNTGASSVRLEGLSNANADTMTFRSGAGSYTLDFSGELQRDMMVDIESGMSTITIIIPEGFSARLEFDGGLSNVSASGGWVQNGDSYTLAGSGPTIKILITMAAGNLELRTK